MPSTVIRFFRYDAERRELLVVFVTSRRYIYEDVPPDVAEAFGKAFSKGQFFNHEIRDRYRYRELEQLA
ncbi:KTSC domain-containing protein [Bradyrhizobium neotropicale]|uniref:KTSC domain-containing protein n=1 Tax=Bradyrhizobium neotropicale TaxID=1497615 RepID=UPI001AD7B28B|nr:KTSC domain-containing protein [Bradyrhizobium neotropicale]MBO4226380.1 KTSC domain-containing protein [Bradyrhizobium neotropicale]